MLVYQDNSVGFELFLCKRFLLFQYICIDAGHVSENALQRSCFAPKILQNHCFQSVPLGYYSRHKGNRRQWLCKMLGGKQRALWYM